MAVRFSLEAAYSLFSARSCQKGFLNPEKILDFMSLVGNQLDDEPNLYLGNGWLFHHFHPFM